MLLLFPLPQLFEGQTATVTSWFHHVLKEADMLLNQFFRSAAKEGQSFFSSFLFSPFLQSLHVL